MFSIKGLALGGIVGGLLVTYAALAADPGRTPSPEEIRLWDIDVRPDGRGLPDGSGAALKGKSIYEDQCLGCHGAGGVGGIKDRLAGGIGSLASDAPLKTVGSYWPYATTVFDYIRRAMPYTDPGSLSNDDTYALTAYILSLNGIVPRDVSLNRQNLPGIKMPNRDGFIPEPAFRVIKNSR